MIYPKYKQLKRYKKLSITMLIVLALASFWYGVWKIYDTYLYANHPLPTIVLTIGAGLIIIAVTHYSLS